MPVVLSPDTIVALRKEHERNAFDCGNDELNLYLQQQARQDAEKHVAAPFVLVERASLVVRGFYTLSSSIIEVGELPDALRKKVPRYPSLPVTLLGRLAVDKAMAGQGIGEFLLVDALRRSLESSQQIGSMAVVVDAKDAAAESFYRHFNFTPYQRTPLRLFVPMRQVAAMFS